VRGIQDVQPIRNKSLGQGLLYHLVEQVPKTLSSQPLTKSAQGGQNNLPVYKTKGSLLGA